jgi:flagellar basal body rod protein FlgG
MKSFRTIFARDLDSASFKGENQGLPAGGATVQTTTVMGDALEGYLDLTSQQLQLTASNMANVDTLAYKTLAFNFESEFARQLHDQAWVQLLSQQFDCVMGSIHIDS